jgi:hypothetical protein
MPPTRRIVASRVGLTDADAVPSNATGIVSALRDVDPMSRVLVGARSASDITAEYLRGISPDFYAIGPQADPDNPVNVIVDEDRNAFFVSVGIDGKGDAKPRFASDGAGGVKLQRQDGGACLPLTALQLTVGGQSPLVYSRLEQAGFRMFSNLGLPNDYENVKAGVEDGFKFTHSEDNGFGGAIVSSVQVWHNEIRFNGTKVLGPQLPAIPDVQIGGTTDANARVAIAAILSALRTNGTIAAS